MGSEGKAFCRTLRQHSVAACQLAIFLERSELFAFRVDTMCRCRGLETDDGAGLIEAAQLGLGTRDSDVVLPRAPPEGEVMRMVGTVEVMCIVDTRSAERQSTWQTSAT